MFHKKISDIQIGHIEAGVRDGLSPKQIRDKYKLDVHVRTVQRICVERGINVPIKKAYEMSVRSGRVGAHKKASTIKNMKLPPVLRYMILKRDNFRCKICGATAENRLLEIDHIDFNPRNNDPQNLQVLCEWCNFGRRKNVA